MISNESMNNHQPFIEAQPKCLKNDKELDLKIDDEREEIMTEVLKDLRVAERAGLNTY